MSLKKQSVARNDLPQIFTYGEDQRHLLIALLLGQLSFSHYIPGVHKTDKLGELFFPRPQINQGNTFFPCYGDNYLCRTRAFIVTHFREKCGSLRWLWQLDLTMSCNITLNKKDSLTFSKHLALH